jgi:hypothetical protein
MHMPSRFHLQTRLRRRLRRELALRVLGGAQHLILGHGAFSTVFAIGRQHVLKVTDARDRTVPWFYRYIRGHTNPHWPRIFRQIFAGRHTVTWMERLHPLNKATRRQVECMDDLLLMCKHTSISQLLADAKVMDCFEAWQDSPSRLREPLLDCHKKAEGLNFLTDSKRDAYMRRSGGILVPVDLFMVGS